MHLRLYIAEHIQCPGAFRVDCPELSKYKFYLDFENSECTEYLTEKLWWNAYNKMSVPIVLGGRSRDDIEKMAPPRSFIAFDDFRHARDLADFLQFLDNHDEFYLRLHDWRRRFGVLNEHGYFGADTRHFCRLCLALNVNDPKPKIYSRLESLWSAKRDCV